MSMSSSVSVCHLYVLNPMDTGRLSYLTYVNQICEAQSMAERSTY